MIPCVEPILKFAQTKEEEKAKEALQIIFYSLQCTQVELFANYREADLLVTKMEKIAEMYPNNQTLTTLLAKSYIKNSFSR